MLASISFMGYRFKAFACENLVHRRSAENPESTETSFLNKAQKAGVFGIEWWYVVLSKISLSETWTSSLPNNGSLSVLTLPRGRGGGFGPWFVICIPSWPNQPSFTEQNWNQEICFTKRGHSTMVLQACRQLLSADKLAPPSCVYLLYHCLS